MRIVDTEMKDFAPEHLDGAVDLSRAAGWPHRRDDWELVLSISQGIVLLDGDRVVGTAMTTPFGRRAATINMVIVDERMRGRGLGRQLMHAAIEAAGDRECRLIATEAGLPLYEILGFRPVGAIAQHQGPAVADHTVAGDGITWSDTPPVTALAVMDRDACGMDREVLIGRLAAAGQVATLHRHDRLAGFAILRPFGRGEVIGPVVAPAAAEAKALLAFVIAARPGAFLRVDTLEGPGLVPWLNERGLVRAGGGIVMTRGGLPPQPTRPFQTFALASQALG
jgi:GNAT superfamily N-acetyltransferase